MLDIVFGDAGYQVEHAMLATQALEIFQAKPIDIVVSDIQMPGMDGLDLLNELRQLDEDVVVIMTTAADSKQYAIESLRRGAFDYVEKPYDEDQLQQIVARGLQHRAERLQDRGGDGGPEVRKELERLRAELAERDEALEAAGMKAEELQTALAEREAELKQQQEREKDLLKKQKDIELREGALQTMDEVLRERMESLKKLQKEKSSGGGLSDKDQAELARLKEELQTREQALQEMEMNIQEREQYIQASEESLMEKGQRLTEIEAELEQKREDAGSGGDVSPEQLEQIESLKAELESKQQEIKATETEIVKRELAVKRAEALIKAREQFLQQSENILFGEEKEKSP